MRLAKGVDAGEMREFAAGECGDRPVLDGWGGLQAMGNAAVHLLPPAARAEFALPVFCPCPLALRGIENLRMRMPRRHLAGGPIVGMVHLGPWIGFRMRGMRMMRRWQVGIRL